MYQHTNGGQRHVVIVGGGFGGIAAARKLLKNPRIKVTLITDSEYFRYNPAMYRVATGYKRQEAILPIRELLPDSPNLDLIVASVERIRRESRTIIDSDSQRHHYDYAILAIGVVTSFFGIPGLDKFAYGIKSPAELQRLHDHLHEQLVSGHHLDKNYVVVGGGPTGVELSASLKSYLKLTARQHHIGHSHVQLELVEAAPRLLPSFNPKVSRVVEAKLKRMGVKVLTNSKVGTETAKSLSVAGRSIPTKTVVWTAGVTNHPFYKANSKEFTLSQRGKVEVNEHLRVDLHTYVIGDNAETQYSGTAQTAVRQGHYAANDITSRLDGKEPRPYKHIKPAYVVPVSANWAVLQYGNLVFTGFLPSLVRRAADLIGYADIMGWPKAIKIWFNSSAKSPECLECAKSEAVRS